MSILKMLKEGESAGHLFFSTQGLTTSEGKKNKLKVEATCSNAG
jgi:hypothetical protein